MLVTFFVSVSFALEKHSSKLRSELKAKDSETLEVTVYKSPTCGCCTMWEEHLKKNGFKIKSQPRDDMDKIKKEYGVKAEIASCHTAIINGYVFEGHVPASDIKRFLKEKPKGVVGLSAPGMPMGSPGMEGTYSDKYDVVTFNKDGKLKTFARH